MKQLAGYVTWKDIPELSYCEGQKYSDCQCESILAYLISLCSYVSTVLQLQVFPLAYVFSTHSYRRNQPSQPFLLTLLNKQNSYNFFEVTGLPLFSHCGNPLMLLQRSEFFLNMWVARTVYNSSRNFTMNLQYFLTDPKHFCYQNFN